MGTFWRSDKGILEAWQLSKYLKAIRGFLAREDFIVVISICGDYFSLSEEIREEREWQDIYHRAPAEVREMIGEIIKFISENKIKVYGIVFAEFRRYLASLADQAYIDMLHSEVVRLSYELVKRRIYPELVEVCFQASEIPQAHQAAAVRDEFERGKVQGVENIIRSAEEDLITLDINNGITLRVDRAILENHLLSEDAIGALIEKAKSEAGFEGVKTIRIIAVDKASKASPFAIQIPDSSQSVIFIYKQIDNIILDKLTREIFIQTGLFHDLCHILFNRFDSDFETEQTPRDVVFTQNLIEQAGLDLSAYIEKLQEYGFDPESEYMKGLGVLAIPAAEASGIKAVRNEVLTRAIELVETNDIELVKEIAREAAQKEGERKYSETDYRAASLALAYFGASKIVSEFGEFIDISKLKEQSFVEIVAKLIFNIKFLLKVRNIFYMITGSKDYTDGKEEDYQRDGKSLFGRTKLKVKVIRMARLVKTIIKILRPLINIASITLDWAANRDALKAGVVIDPETMRDSLNKTFALLHSYRAEITPEIIAAVYTAALSQVEDFELAEVNIQQLSAWFGEEVDNQFQQVPTSIDAMYLSAGAAVLYVITGRIIYRLIDLRYIRDDVDINSVNTYDLAYRHITNPENAAALAVNLPLTGIQNMVNFEIFKANSKAALSEITSVFVAVPPVVPPVIEKEVVPAPEYRPSFIKRAFASLAKWLSRTALIVIRFSLSAGAAYAVFEALNLKFELLNMETTASFLIVSLLVSLLALNFTAKLLKFSFKRISWLPNLAQRILSLLNPDKTLTRILKVLGLVALSPIIALKYIPQLISKQKYIRGLVEVIGLLIILSALTPLLVSYPLVATVVSGFFGFWVLMLAWTWLDTPVKQLKRPAVLKGIVAILVPSVFGIGVYLSGASLGSPVLAIGLGVIVFILTAGFLLQRYFSLQAPRSVYKAITATFVSAGLGLVVYEISLSSLTFAASLSIGIVSAITLSLISLLLFRGRGKVRGFLITVFSVFSGLVGLGLFKLGLMALSPALGIVFALASFIATFVAMLFLYGIPQQIIRDARLHRQIIDKASNEQTIDQLIYIITENGWTYKDIANAYYVAGFISEEQHQLLNMDLNDPDADKKLLNRSIDYRESFVRVIDSIWQEFGHLQSIRMRQDLIEQLPGKGFDLERIPSTIIEGPSGEVWLIVGVEPGLEAQEDDIRQIKNWADKNGIRAYSSEGLLKVLWVDGKAVIPRVHPTDNEEAEIPSLAALRQGERRWILPKNFIDNSVAEMYSPWYRKYELVLRIVYKLMSKPLVRRALGLLDYSSTKTRVAHYIRPLISPLDALVNFVAVEREQVRHGQLGLARTFWQEWDRERFTTGKTGKVTIDDVSNFMGLEFAELIFTKRSARERELRIGFVRIRELAAVHMAASQPNLSLARELLTKGAGKGKDFVPTRDKVRTLASPPIRHFTASFKKVMALNEAVAKFSQRLREVFSNIPVWGKEARELVDVGSEAVLSVLSGEALSSGRVSELLQDSITKGRLGSKLDSYAQTVREVFDWARETGVLRPLELRRRAKTLLLVSLIELYAQDRFGKKAGEKIAELIADKLEIETILRDFVSAGILTREEADIFSKDKSGLEEWFWAVQMLWDRYYLSAKSRFEVSNFGLGAVGVKEYMVAVPNGALRRVHIYGVDWRKSAQVGAINVYAERVRHDLTSRLTVDDLAGDILYIYPGNGESKDNAPILIDDKKNKKSLSLEQLQALIQGEPIKLKGKKSKYYPSHSLKIIDVRTQGKIEDIHTLNKEQIVALLQGQQVVTDDIDEDVLFMLDPNFNDAIDRDKFEGKELEAARRVVVARIDMNFYAEEMSKRKAGAVGLDTKLIKPSADTRDLGRFLRKERLSLSASGKGTLSKDELRQVLASLDEEQLRSLIELGNSDGLKASFKPVLVNETGIEVGVGEVGRFKKITMVDLLDKNEMISLLEVATGLDESEVVIDGDQRMSQLFGDNRWNFNRIRGEHSYRLVSLGIDKVAYERFVMRSELLELATVKFLSLLEEKLPFLTALRGNKTRKAETEISQAANAFESALGELNSEAIGVTPGTRIYQILSIAAKWIPGLNQEGTKFTSNINLGKLISGLRSMAITHENIRAALDPYGQAPWRLDPLLVALTERRLYGTPLPIEVIEMAQLALSSCKRLYRQGDGKLDLDTAVDPVKAKIMLHFLNDPRIIDKVLRELSDIADQDIANDLVKSLYGVLWWFNENIRVTAEQRADREYVDILMEIMIGIRSRQIFGQGRVQLRDTKGNPVFEDENGNWISAPGSRGNPVMVSAAQQGLANLIVGGAAVNAAELSSVLFFVPNPILKEVRGRGDLPAFKLHSAAGRKAFWRVLMTMFERDLKKTLPYGSFYNPRPGEASATMQASTFFGTKLNIIPVAAGVNESIDAAQREISLRLAKGEYVHVAEDIAGRLNPEILAHPALVVLRNFTSMARENPERFLSFAQLGLRLARISGRTKSLRKLLRSYGINEEAALGYLFENLSDSAEGNAKFLKSDAIGLRLHQAATQKEVSSLLETRELGGEFAARYYYFRFVIKDS